MAILLTNTLLNYKKRTLGNYTVSDYFSIDVPAIKAYFNTLPTIMFDHIRVDGGDKWEHVAHEVYGNADYWDILMLLNNRNPITGLPFEFDVNSAIADQQMWLYLKSIINDPFVVGMNRPVGSGSYVSVYPTPPTTLSQYTAVISSPNTPKAMNDLHNSVEQQAVSTSNIHAVVKIIHPTDMGAFLQGGYDLGLF